VYAGIGNTDPNTNVKLFQLIYVFSVSLKIPW
jgi:hypothetical protein